MSTNVSSVKRPSLPALSASERRRNQHATKGTGNCTIDKVVAAIAQTGYHELNAIRVSVTGNTIHLSGVVRSYYQKQLAQHIAHTVAPTWLIRNGLTVVSRDQELSPSNCFQ